MRYSVHFGDNTRFNEALSSASQSVNKEEMPRKVVELANEFFKDREIPHISYEKARVEIPESPSEEFYEELYRKIKEDNKLTCETDILWMKFTDDGHPGVLACSNDINFDIPPSSEVYDERVFDAQEGEDRWKYTTSGILVHSVGLRWDESFVLVVPLPGLDGGHYERHQLEYGLGEYLIQHGIPIIDRYSHLY